MIFLSPRYLLSCLVGRIEYGGVRLLANLNVLHFFTCAGFSISKHPYRCHLLIEQYLLPFGIYIRACYHNRPIGYNAVKVMSKGCSLDSSELKGGGISPLSRTSAIVRARSLRRLELPKGSQRDGSGASCRLPVLFSDRSDEPLRP